MTFVANFGKTPPRALQGVPVEKLLLVLVASHVSQQLEPPLAVDFGLDLRPARRSLHHAHAGLAGVGGEDDLAPPGLQVRVHERSEVVQHEELVDHGVPEQLALVVSVGSSQMSLS